MVFFGERVGLGGDSNQGCAEEGGEHGEGTDGEVVLTAEPFGDFTGFATKGIGKLLFGESSLLHKELDCIGDVEGEVYLGLDLLWYYSHHLLEFIADCFHCFLVFRFVDHLDGVDGALVGFVY